MRLHRKQRRTERIDKRYLLRVILESLNRNVLRAMKRGRAMFARGDEMSQPRVFKQSSDARISRQDEFEIEPL